jgi:hypothetical protein
MVNNQLVDFSDERYLTTLERQNSRYVHLHDPDNVVHVHASGVTWEYFFRTINVTLDSSCLWVRGEPLCKATFMRNSTIVPGLLEQEIQEGDRALFHFGAGNVSIFFEQAVGNRSCLHSGTCLERGYLPGCRSGPDS